MSRFIFDRLKAAVEDARAGRVRIICPHCHVAMTPGQAIKQTVRGSEDFPGAEVVTHSPGGPGKLVTCWKCPECGASKEK